MSEHAFPGTRGGKLYRGFLGVAGIAAIVGLADAARALLWLLLETAGGGSPPTPRGYGMVSLRLAAWSLVAFAAYQGWVLRRIPSTWAIIAVVLLAWALILL